MGRFFKTVPRYVWILLAIVAVGTFFRSYNFHNWLDFGSDQANDATRVSDVVEGRAPWPLLGPDMSKSGGGSRDTRFRLGPMYYYFEIVSAKVFGDTPDAMAYPDLLFSVLSIPLLYYFLRNLFGRGTSLALAGLYATSFYVLWFSHSAWNPNSIPFFAMLFLLSLLEMLLNRNKVSWWWVVALGVALGVGVQLHAILLVLFPVVAFGVFIITLRSDPKMWIKWMAVVALVLVFNSGQIRSELQNNFKNTKTFFSSVTGSSTTDTGESLLFGKSVDTLGCTIEANAYMLSSIGSGDCNFTLADIIHLNFSRQVMKNRTDPATVVTLCAEVVFSFLGYWMLLTRTRKETDRRKRYFFRLVAVYLGVSFLVFMPVVSGALRYFVHLFFVPLIFFGLFVEYVVRKCPKKYLLVVIPLYVIIVVANLVSLRAVIGDGHIDGRIVMAELDPMVAYIKETDPAAKEVYILMNGRYIQNYYKSLAYLAQMKGVMLIRVNGYDEIVTGKPVFSVERNNIIHPETMIEGHTVRSFRNFPVTAMCNIDN